MDMDAHRPWKRYACAVHTGDVVERLRPLVPRTDEVDGPVGPAELADWVSVEAEREPEIAGHCWRVDLDDAVGLFLHPDRDDLAEALEEQPGVRAVVRLDREVFVVRAPSLCADGLRAAVLQAVAAANERAHDPGGRADAAPRDRSRDVRAGAEPTVHGPRTVTPSPDDDAPRLVTGDARSEGRSVQVWVDRRGILILPAGTIPHGPLDPSENPRFQRASFTAAEAARLAEQHAGRWVPVSTRSRLTLHRPGRILRRWTATITEDSGPPVTLSWRGTRRHALLLWLYVVAGRGPGPVDGRP